LSYLAAAAVAFGLTFLGELPDKSLFASLVLGTRYRPAYVWAGAAAAFAVQMAIAVTAGRLLSLLPHHLVDAIVAVLFLAGSAYLWVTSFRPQHPEGMDAARQGGPPASFLRIAGTSFGVVFLAEWGDITQLTAANLADRSNPVAVFAGASRYGSSRPWPSTWEPRASTSSPWPGSAASPPPSCSPSVSTQHSQPCPADRDRTTRPPDLPSARHPAQIPGLAKPGSRSDACGWP
jgi:putative Ca2+/H+ antiporter (TMEM165/GDT1 family)